MTKPEFRDESEFRRSLGRLFIKKSVASLVEQGERRSGLRRTLGPVSLTLLGIGAIIGTGIFVLTGVAAKNYGGPAIWLAFVIAGLVSLFAALAYAELASMIPVSGSAYTYAYAGIGEIVAWVIAWDLVLEYAVGSMTVAIGWSGYMVGLFESVSGIALAEEWIKGPMEGGYLNVPATGIVLAVTSLLVYGMKESAGVTNFLVAIKVGVIIFIIGLGSTILGRSSVDYGSVFFHESAGFMGLFSAAGVVFFAFIGFDALSTTAEETRNPKRDLPIGIIASLLVSTLFYIIVSYIIVHMQDYRDLDVNEPLAAAFRIHGVDWAANVIAVSAVAGITSVLIVLLLSQPRILFSMARDGLLPKFIATVHPVYRTPYVATLLTGFVVAAVAGLVPIGVVATVANIGTLFAFCLVSGVVMILRYKEPHARRGYRVPGPAWLIPGLGVLSSFGLMLALPALTWLVFLAWFGLGLVVYAVYGYYRSNAASEAAAREAAAFVSAK